MIKKIDLIGIQKFHIYLVIILGLANAVDAIEISSLTYILGIWEKQYTYSAMEKSLVTSSVFVGMLFGGIVFGKLADMYGRKLLLIISLSVNGLSVLLASFTQSLTQYIILRLVTGFGIGGSVPIIFSLAAEHLPNKNRGAGLGIVAAFWMMGVLFTGIMGWILFEDSTDESAWRKFSVLTSIPPLVCAVLIYFHITESPRFFVNQGKINHALETISKLEKLNSPEKVHLQKDPDIRYCDIEIPKDEVVVETFFQLFDSSLLVTSISFIVTYFSLSFGSYGISTWITVLFEKVGISDEILSTLIYAFGNLPGNIISVFLMDKVDRNRMLSISLILSCLSIFLFAIEIKDHNAVEIVFISFLFNSFTTAAWNTIDILSTEAFPTSIRATATGFLISMGRFGSISAQWINGYLIQANESSVALSLFITSFALLLGFVATLFIQKRTNQLNL